METVNDFSFGDIWYIIIHLNSLILYTSLRLGGKHKVTYLLFRFATKNILMPGIFNIS